MLSVEDKEYLMALKAARIKIVSGTVQQYSIGSRSLSYLDLRWINEEIARLEGFLAPRFRRVRVIDR